ncbi:MAG TPA: hypothetical protein V6C97_07480 [Oculatellaceae cyanobacterium]
MRHGKNQLSEVIIASLLVQTGMAMACPECKADCAAAVPTTPVTVNDETSTSPSSRQLVNGAATIVDTSSPGQIKVSLPSTGVTAGSYKNPTLTVDAYGRLTAASSASGGATIDGRIYINQPEGFGVNTRDVVGGTAGSYSGTISNGAVVGGYLTNRVTTGSSSGNIGSITAADPITAYSLKPVWTCALSPHTVSNVRYWIGVYDSALSGSDSPTANFAAFRASTSAGDTNYKFVTGDNTGSVTVTDTGVSFTADTPHKFRIDMSGYPSAVTASIDGVVVATNTTHLPGTSSQFYQSATVQTLTSSAAAADIGYIACSSEGNTPSSGSVSSVSAADSSMTVTPNIGAVTVKIANSAALPGSPTTTTQSSGDNSTKIATTAYVDRALGNLPLGMSNDPSRHSVYYQPLGGNTPSTNCSWNDSLITHTYAVVTAANGNKYTCYQTSLGSASAGCLNGNIGFSTLQGHPVLTSVFGSSVTSGVRLWISNSTTVNTGTDTPTNTSGFRYSDGAGDTHWMLYASDGTIATLDTGVTPDTNVHTFQLVYSGSSMTGYIDGVSVGTLSSHLPTTTWTTSVLSMSTASGVSGTFTLGRQYFEAY